MRDMFCIEKYYKNQNLQHTVKQNHKGNQDTLQFINVDQIRLTLVDPQKLCKRGRYHQTLYTVD
jgi:hypothetical protein